MAVKQDGIIAIPGVPYGIKWDGLCWALYHNRPVRNQKTGKTVMMWAEPCYPVDFNHMAQIIARDCGKEAKDGLAFLQEIKKERERLESVLSRIISAVAPEKGT